MRSKKQLIKAGVFFLILLSIFGIYFYNYPKDIRNSYLRSGITDEKIEKGKVLLQKIEDAYGGRTNWESYQELEFVQLADWYGRLAISHWDTLPQRFRLTAHLKSGEMKMELLNGKNKGGRFKIVNQQYFQAKGEWEQVEKNPYHTKMEFKNYWFQFPFKIWEASIISYAGEEKLNGQLYSLLYATWGSEKANKNYDQFILYINKNTFQIDHLYFTVREVLKPIAMTASFTNYKTVNGFNLAHSQYVRYGKPNENGMKFHENHYEDIRFKK